MIIKIKQPDPVEALADKRATAKSECHRRILVVARETTQLNLAAAAGAGLLSESDMQAYRAGIMWIGSMRAAWKPLAESGADLSDDKNWPTAPVAVIELGRRW